MMAAYFAKFQGIDLLSENNSALNRLALAILKGYADPEIFAAKTGVKQEFKLKESTAWLAVYDTLRPGNKQVAQLLEEFPPIQNRALGGITKNVDTVPNVVGLISRYRSKCCGINFPLFN
jgi:hypothetical protein